MFTNADLYMLSLQYVVLAKELVEELKENHLNAKVVDESLKVRLTVNPLRCNVPQCAHVFMPN